jgi:hypothetical protein
LFPEEVKSILHRDPNKMTPEIERARMSALIKEVKENFKPTEYSEEDAK